MSRQNLLLAAGLMLAAVANGQSSLDALAGQFVQHIREGRKEKLVVLTDKQYYAAGESIWLKAWCLDSLSNRFLFVSKNLFVDLVNDKDSVISQILFNIPAQKTAGMILLPANLPEGYYWLRAYTARILAEDSSHIFVKPIYIVNPNKPEPHALSAYTAKTTDAPEDTAAPQLLFYPEGGSIISGTTATIGYRSVGSRGEPVDVKGFVTDPLHDTVARFTTTIDGTGKFSFDAYNPRKYTAHIDWRGRDLLFPLPPIDQYANQLSLIGRDNKTLHLQVSQGDSLYKKHKATRILAVSRDSLCFAATGTDMYQVTVPIAGLPAGKVTFFLFDDHDRLVSQRSVYVGNSDSGRIVAATDKPDYSPGEKVNLSIGVKPQGDRSTIEALLAVSVTNDRLTGNRGGAASGEELPVFGLPAEDEGLAAAGSNESTDVRMLVQTPIYKGWQYEQGGKAPTGEKRFADSNLLNISGKAVSQTNEPLSKYIVAIVSGDNKFFSTDTTDEQGRFQFALSEYDDGTRFNMKLTNLNGKGVEGKLIMNKMDYPRFATPKSLKHGLVPNQMAMIRRFREITATIGAGQQKDSGMLKPVTVQTGRKKLSDEDEAKRSSSFSDVITPDQIRKGGVDAVKNALASIPGLTSAVNRVIGGGAGGGSIGTDPILIVMDGVPVNTGGDIDSYIQSLDATNIEFIEVLKGPLTAIYGMQGSGGVILINSVKNGADVAQTNGKGVTTIYPKGYYNKSDVYASGWDRKKEKANADAAADQVSTLYWNANVLTDNKGKTSVDFFTGHQQGLYSAAIVGITMSGDVVEKEIKIKCR